MARRRRPAPPPLDMEPPDWVWQYRRTDPQWRREGDGGPDNNWCVAEVKARSRWFKAVRAWLDERGLEMWPHFRGDWQQFKQLRQAEPHRVLRRPEPR